MAETIVRDVNQKFEKQPRVAERVVDADVHVNPPPTFWATYLSSEFRGRAPTVESDGEVDYIVFEGERRKVNLLSSRAGRSVEEFKSTGKLSDMRAGGWMVESRLEDMDRDGIDAGVCFGGGPLQTSDISLYMDSFDAFNRWQSDFCSDSNKRLFAAAFLPMVDVQHTVGMMRAAKARGDVAVNLPAFPQSLDKFTKKDSVWQAMTGDVTGKRMYRDPEFDPLWAAAVELDMPITFHLGARVTRFKDKDNFLVDHVMGKPAMLEIPAIMIYGGIFDRFPNLRIGLIESQVGWIPWAANYMDRSWDMQRHWVGSPIKHSPSYYFDRNIYASFISDPVGVRLRDLPGGKNIMWSSDYPHSETSFPYSHRSIEHDLAGASPEERDWILAGCAEKFYGIKIGRTPLL
jgi:predicted TIM-barrel fold metal-dependent hydrolase